jgi:hypothetical protein
MSIGGEAVNVGVAPGNLFARESSGRFVQQILEARLREELRRGNPPKVSESDVEHDWTLLQKALQVPDDEVATRSPRPLPASVLTGWSGASNRR